MASIFATCLLVLITYLLSGAFVTVWSALPQTVGWGLMALGDSTNIVIFYVLITYKNKTNQIHQIVSLFIGIICCFMMWTNYFGYYGQMVLQNIVLLTIGTFAYQFYKAAPRHSYQIKVLSAVQAFYHCWSWLLNGIYLIFFTPEAHDNPLTLNITKIGVGTWTPIIIISLLGFLSLYRLYVAKAHEHFNPNEDYILHFLPLKDGLRTYFAFLFAMLPIPHYAIWDGTEKTLYKFSQKENGLVAHNHVKLDGLFKRGLILICEPVQLKNRLKPLVGKVEYCWWKGETCWKMVRYVKGEINRW
jgi:hypothetical protein